MKNSPELVGSLWATSEIPNLAERSFFSTMEAFASGTLATDARGVIVWINDKYCRLLGVEAAKLIGRAIRSALPGTRIPEVLSSGQPIVLDVMEHDGRQYVVSRFPVFDNQKKVIGAFGFVLYDGVEQFALLLERLAHLPASLHGPGEKNEPLRAAHTSPARFYGSSAAARHVRLLSEKAAATNACVLITGPTGCGKEVVAHAVHRDSERGRRHFVAVNVGAIPETLFEAEFFGTAPGAYTGADRRGRMGKLQLADGGTLFLDEIGDMPTSVQVKLLRFLETGEFELLGSNQLQRSDARVIAATSVDLRKAVAEKRFRADLYYRLAVFPIAVPALRDRSEDIPELSHLLLDQIAKKNNAPRADLLPCAMARLQSFPWPGNARELRNLLERCSIFAGANPIDANLVVELSEPEELPPEAVPPDASGSCSLDQAVAALESQMISAALAASHGSMMPAARRLGISRTTLYKKARQFGLMMPGA
jgi:transcriptional regulator with PAS, ATPase and Fis domain